LQQGGRNHERKDRQSERTDRFAERIGLHSSMAER
jgi:hypothetical protein